MTSEKPPIQLVEGQLFVSTVYEPPFLTRHGRPEVVLKSVVDFLIDLKSVSEFRNE